MRTFADEVALVVSGERLEADLREAELYRRCRGHASFAPGGGLA